MEKTSVKTSVTNFAILVLILNMLLNFFKF